MNPSLLLIPDRYKAAKLYSQIPDSGAGDLTFARASVATRVNASGLIESVASGVPRLDYPVSGGCPSLLLEPQRTNIASYNETDGGTWGATTPVASGTILGVNAYTIFSNVSLGDNPHNQMTSQFVAGQTYTASVIVDFGFLTANFELALLMVATAGVSVQGVTVDRITKAITLSTAVNEMTVINGKATQIQGDIYKIEVTIAISSGATSISSSRAYCLSTTNLTTARIAALQVEDGSYSTSYISKTTTASVTRLADAASKTGISSLIGQTEGTLFVEEYYDASVANNNGLDDVLVALTDGTTNNVVLILHYGVAPAGYSNAARFFIRTAGATQALFDSVALPTGTYKMALAYKNNDVVAYINGVQIGTDTSATIPATSVITLVDPITTNAATKTVNIKTAALYPVRLSNSELASLTSL
jgi:uncharacterized protein with FMN-binding domain